MIRLRRRKGPFSAEMRTFLSKYVRFKKFLTGIENWLVL